MMTPTVLDSEQVTQRKIGLFGEGTNEEVIIAEALRAELWARRVAIRRSLCSQVSRLLQPVVETDNEQVRSVLEQLERIGDVTSGSRGQVAAAPLRAISVSPKKVLLAGGPDSVRLGQALGVPVDQACELRVAEGDQADLEESIEAFGGICLSAERWAGLDRSPVADEQWLQMLDAELHHQKQPPERLPEDLGLWAGLVPGDASTPINKRWVAADKAGKARLWRSWHDHGYWFFAWTSGGAPAAEGFVRLPADHAHRTFFALHRVSGSGVCMDTLDSKDDVELNAAVMLPRAEYRYLLTVGRRADGPGLRYRIPKDAWPAVLTLLESRLGVVLGTGATT